MDRLTESDGDEYEYGTHTMKKQRRFRWRQIWIVGTIGIFLISYSVLVCTGVLNSWLSAPLTYTQNPTPADLIFIPGFSTTNQCTPTPALLNRLRTAIYLYQHEYAPVMLAAGGFSSTKCFECETMRNTLLYYGIPSSQIYMECASTSTYENIQFSRSIFHQLDVASVLVVTDSYHTWRCYHLFKKIGIQVRCISSNQEQITHIYTQPISWQWNYQFRLIREYIAVIYYWLAGYV
jgi:uncharacterized SAM-binding protein YcdF (DUF218 family)